MLEHRLVPISLFFVVARPDGLAAASRRNVLSCFYFIFDLSHFPLVISAPRRVFLCTRIYIYISFVFVRDVLKRGNFFIAKVQYLNVRL